MSAPNQHLRILVLFGNIPMWGQERANIQVYEVLKERGVESLFVTNRQWGHLHVQPALGERGLAWTTATMVGRFRRGMGVRGWFANLWAMLRGSVELAAIVRRFKPDGLHVANPVFFVNFVFFILATRLPLVYRLGDAPADSHLLYRALWRYVIAPRVTRFVCDSNFIQRELLATGVPEQRTTVVYPPPPKRTAPKGVEVFRRDAHAFTVVFVGQLSPHKGVHLLVEAAKSVLQRTSSLRVLIAGDYAWQNPYATEIIENVRASGLEAFIKFLGNVEDVPALLASGDVHVCPTLSEEPLGLVVMEAKEVSRPSIVFPVGGLVEIVTHGTDGYICSDKTAAALEGALETYLSDRDLAARHGTQARESLDRLGVYDLGEKWQQIWLDAVRTSGGAKRA